MTRVDLGTFPDVPDSARFGAVLAGGEWVVWDYKTGRRVQFYITAPLSEARAREIAKAWNSR